MNQTIVPNGRPDVEHVTSHVDVGEKVTFRCDVGYQPVPRDQAFLVCQADGFLHHAAACVPSCNYIYLRNRSYFCIRICLFDLLKLIWLYQGGQSTLLAFLGSPEQFYLIS